MEERREIRRSLDELSRSMGQLASTVAEATQTLRMLKPEVEAGKRARWIGIGALAMVGATTGALGNKIAAFLGIAGGHP